AVRAGLGAPTSTLAGSMSTTSQPRGREPVGGGEIHRSTVSTRPASASRVRRVETVSWPDDSQTSLRDRVRRFAGRGVNRREPCVGEFRQGNQTRGVRVSHGPVEGAFSEDVGNAEGKAASNSLSSQLIASPPETGFARTRVPDASTGWTTGKGDVHVFSNSRPKERGRPGPSQRKRTES